MLRVAFAGTPPFAVPALQALAASGHRLVGVLTQPDRPAGRGRQIQPSAVKVLARQLGVPIAQPAQLRSAAQLAELAAWQPDVLVVVAYGLILGPEALTLPPLGCVNVHASLLPRWRGAAPIQHAILAGDRQTGVSIMLMNAGLDTGPVLATCAVPIESTDTTATLAARLAQQGAGLLMPVLADLEAGCARPLPQSEQQATYAPKIDRALAQIDWGLSAEQIARQVRAFNPRPVAYTSWYGQPLRIWEAEPVDPGQASPVLEGIPATVTDVPGTVLEVVDGRLVVQSGQGLVGVGRLQLAGRRPVSAREFAGSTSPVGARLGS